MYLVKCEKLDKYKSGVRAQLRAWLEDMSKQQREWLVVYLPLGIFSPGGPVKPKTYQKIFERIRSDVSARTKRKGSVARCVRVDLFPSTPE